jgi:hypothetical protein
MSENGLATLLTEALIWLPDADSNDFEEPGTLDFGPQKGHTSDLISHQQATANPATAGFVNEGTLTRDDDCVETPDMPENGHAALLTEALSGLPDDEKVAYREAMRKAPCVVKTESEPLKYLRFEKFNAWAAACRLALYWKYRVQYFGDKAFLPLTQNKGGALWEEDLQTLAVGSFFFLPTDSKGRPVLCCDPSKCPEGTSDVSRIRVAMYFFTILCYEYPAAMTEGCLFLFFARDRMMGPSNGDNITRRVIDIVFDAFPVGRCEAHVICCPSSTASAQLFTKFMLPALIRAIGRLLSHDQSKFHVGDTAEELRHTLAACGLSGTGLEAAVNGGISNHDFAEWMKSRKLLELPRCDHADQVQQTQALRQQKPPNLPLPPNASKLAAPGTTTNPTNDPSVTRVVVHDGMPHGVTSAIASFPAFEKMSYLEALEKVPDLVGKESDPVKFLRFENSDPLAAARRLVSYWRIRCETFRDRAFLPMDQTGEGALDRRDLAVLNSAFLTQLPNDSSGCSVICCDGSRLEKCPPHSAQLRIFFYLWSMVLLNDLSLTNGYCLLFTMPDPPLEQALIDSLGVITLMWPARLKCFHLLCCCRSGTNDLSRCKTVAKDITNLLGPSGEGKVKVHVCESRSRFASKLSDHGLSKDGLPKAFGGGWGLEEFLQWQELRIRNEWSLPISAALGEVAESYCIPVPASQKVPILADEKAERSRRLTVLYSRRMRYRTQIRMQALEDQCSELRSERTRLLREGHELEELVQRATTIVKEENQL